jgi:polyisoprenoid-binding protein YceI
MIPAADGAIRLEVCLAVVMWCALTMACQAEAQTKVATADQPSEQLIVFVQPGPGAVAQAFEQQTLAQVRKLAETMDVAVVVVDVTRRGAPPDVPLTPWMVYQNHLGRFPYLGRFTTIDRLKNHIRTARFGGAPQDVSSPAQAMPRQRQGRTIVGTPIKITKPAGAHRQSFDAEAFQQHARQSIQLVLSPDAEQEPAKRSSADRLFYTDFYPYRSEDGQLFVATALFSQFHCHEPLFVSQEPVSGPIEHAAAVFQAAVRVLQAEINRQLVNPAQGDGFDPIAADVKSPSWSVLGLPLPPKPQRGSAQNVGKVALVRNWEVDKAALERNPMVQFRFPKPIVGFAGEATELGGSLKLGQNLSLTDATGKFIVPTKSITMGEPDLDSYLRSGILGARNHPESSYVLESIETTQPKLVFGRVIPATLVGQFTMKGITVALKVPASIEAYVAEDGQPRLAIQGTWTLQLEDPFGITDLPPGPQEAASRLVFNTRIVLMPSQ